MCAKTYSGGRRREKLARAGLERQMMKSMRKRPVYMIGIAAELIGLHPQTLRMYEHKGLLRPRKSIKNTRLYSQEDIELGRYIQKLTQEMGMNLAGVKKVLDQDRRIERLEADNLRLRRELEKLELEHKQAVREVHRSYKREIVLLPRAEISRRRF